MIGRSLGRSPGGKFNDDVARELCSCFRGVCASSLPYLLRCFMTTRSMAYLGSVLSGSVRMCQFEIGSFS